MARGAGWKKSGIISKRNIVEMLSTEILSAPVAKGKPLIADSYAKVLVHEANNKLRQTRKKIANLLKLLR